MGYGLLAATTEPVMRAAEGGRSEHLVNELYQTLVVGMPYGGLSLMFVLIGLTLVVGLYIAWGQRTLANNQVRIAQMLAEHLAEHRGQSKS